jgi:hypothetical protein
VCDRGITGDKYATSTAAACELACGGHTTVHNVVKQVTPGTQWVDCGV